MRSRNLSDFIERGLDRRSELPSHVMDAEGGGVMLDPSAKTISMLPKAENAHFEDYRRRLLTTLETCDWQPIAELADELLDCARTGRQVFLAGNGGSAANAVHLANDFLYAWSKQQGRGISRERVAGQYRNLELPGQRRRL